MILIFLVCGLLLYVVFFMLKKYFKKTLFFKRLSHNMDIYLYRIQFVLWSLYFIVGLYFLFKTNTLLTSVILIACSPVLINIILGLFLRFEGVIQKGKSMSFGNATGSVSRFYLTRMSLFDSQNKEHFFSYIYIFFSKWRRVKEQVSNSDQHVFSIIVGSETVDESVLKKSLMRNEWVNMLAPIYIMKEGPEMKITCQLLDSNRKHEVARYLNNYFDNI